MVYHNTSNTHRHTNVKTVHTHTKDAHVSLCNIARHLALPCNMFSAHTDFGSRLNLLAELLVPFFFFSCHLSELVLHHAASLT